MNATRGRGREADPRFACGAACAMAMARYVYADGRVDPEIGGCAASAHVGAPAGRVSDPACRTLCGARRDLPMRESPAWNERVFAV